MKTQKRGHKKSREMPAENLETLSRGSAPFPGAEQAVPRRAPFRGPGTTIEAVAPLRSPGAPRASAWDRRSYVARPRGDRWRSREPVTGEAY